MSDNIEQKLVELSQELQRLQSLLLKEKNDFQPPQGEYSLLFSASQNSMKSKISENSYFNQSSDLHEINDLLLTVDEVCKEGESEFKKIPADLNYSIAESEFRFEEENSCTDDELDQLLVVVNDAIEEPYKQKPEYKYESSNQMLQNFSHLELSRSEYEPVRVTDLTGPSALNENMPQYHKPLDRSIHYQRYPKVEYDTMVEDDTIMESAVRSIQQKYLGRSENENETEIRFVNQKDSSISTNAYLKRHHLQNSNSTNIEQNTRFLDLDKLARLPKLR